jgi:hypothetical protein
LNGSAFSARVQIDGLSVEKAFSQLRPGLARDGIKTISTDLTTGILKAENPATLFQLALPVDVYATADGNLLNVEMIFTLPSGVTAKRDTVKQHLCSALNQLLPKETATAAPSPAEQPAIEIDAAILAKQVKAAADNPARLRLNFIGKTFRVTGKVLGIAEHESSYRVTLDGMSPTTGKDAKDQKNRLTILCTMAKNQDATVAALQTNQRATLVGRFQSFDNPANTIQIQNCTGK